MVKHLVEVDVAGIARMGFSRYFDARVLVVAKERRLGSIVQYFLLAFGGTTAMASLVKGACCRFLGRAEN